MLKFCNWTAVIVLMFIPSILTQADCTHHSAWNLRPRGRMSNVDIVESSGVVSSRQFGDVLWTHNDSDNAPKLFAVNQEGELIRSYIVPQATNHDWEDIATDQDGNLYLLDNTSRSDPQHRNFIYIVREPDPFKDQVLAPARRVTIRFPDGGHDCEAIMVWDGVIYLITKPWDGSLPRIYSINDFENRGTAEFLGHIPIQVMITGADISADGRRIALCSYRALLIFDEVSDPARQLRTNPLICRLNARQVEAIAWKGEELILTNEQRELFQISKSQWKRQAAPFLKIPQKSVPYVRISPSIRESLKNWSKGRWLTVAKNRPWFEKFLLKGRRDEKIGRVVWSSSGLHVGVNLPKGFQLRTITASTTPGDHDWFKPGSIYLMVNPGGTRPLTYGKDDRCIVLGRTTAGDLVAHVKSLRPATLVESSETMPEWLRVESHDRQLLITFTQETPGMDGFNREKTLGFNLLLIEGNGEMVSWTPLTQKHPWDTPSIWGLLELKK